MIFKISCFVRVEDAKRRNKLIRWCEDVIGRNGGFPVGADWIVGEFVLCIRDVTYCCRHEELFLLNNDAAIDCGENIELFKALAAMNDENDREQWFVCMESYKESESISWEVGDFDFHYLDEDYAGKKWRKATAEEIIEYFNHKLP